VICNGLRDGALEAVLKGESEGTRFTPQETGHSSFKLWLKYAKPAHGTLIVDAGAARALREGNASLLPVGIVGVEGEFEAGDAVEIAGETGTKTIAKGICNYSADELKRVIGMKSEAVRGILPHATDEAVHRDYLVVG
jgi:glutamate 5-kinase